MTSTAPAPQPAADREQAKPSSRRRPEPLDILERWGLLALFVLLVVGFSIADPDTFATLDNARAIASGQSVVAVCALALIVPLVADRFDVSVGAVLGVSSIMTAQAMSAWGLPAPWAVLVGLLTGAIIGLVNGVVVAYLGVNSLIATLGTATVLGGLVQWGTNGTPITTDISEGLTSISLRQVAGIPLIAVIMLGVAVVVWFLLSQTVFGRELAAIGGSIEAAQLVGIRVQRNIMLSFVVSGALAGVAGVLQLAQQGSGDPSVGGIAIILPALAAVFLGATAFTPGSFNVPGAILGLFFVGVAVSGLVLLGARPWVQPVFNGGAVVIAVALSQLARRRRTGVAVIGS